MLLPIQATCGISQLFLAVHFKDTDEPKWLGNVPGQVLESRTTSYRKSLLETHILS